MVCGSDRVGQSGPGSEVKLSGKTEFHDRMDSSGSLFLQNGVVHSKHVSLRELYKHQASVIAGLNNQEEESEDRFFLLWLSVVLDQMLLLLPVLRLLRLLSSLSSWSHSPYAGWCFQVFSG